VPAANPTQTTNSIFIGKFQRYVGFLINIGCLTLSSSRYERAAFSDLQTEAVAMSKKNKVI
jgi:hypothetical protein